MVVRLKFLKVDIFKTQIMWIFKPGENEAVNLDHTLCIEKKQTSIYFHFLNDIYTEYNFDDDNERDEYFNELMRLIGSSNNLKL